MDKVYITNIHINKVRHLKDMDIPFSDGGAGMKHLILTGKNGSGKTSLLDAVAVYLNSVSTSNDPHEAIKNHRLDLNNLEYARTHSAGTDEIEGIQERISCYEKRIESSTGGVSLSFNISEDGLKSSFQHGDYILAYYTAGRSFHADVPESIEKVKVKDFYGINEKPRQKFLKYMLDMKMVQAMAAASYDKGKAKEVQHWFDRIESIMRRVYDDPSLHLEFDMDTYQFSINENGREPFDFNTASDGFSAVLDIVVDLILRMQQQNHRIINFTKPGIVLVDEIETHLHLELQRNILGYLTELFPNIQFIVSTHSPFVVNSLDDAVIYDLEKRTLVEHGLTNVSYSGVVEGYFHSDHLSEELRKKFEEYKSICGKDTLSNDDLVSLASLEKYLDEIPDYLSIDVASEYSELKSQLHSRKDI